MKSVIKVAKTVDDAVDEALAELEASKDQVEIEIIEEANKGFLGLIGTKDATVKVSILDNSLELADVFLKEVLKAMNIDAKFSVRKVNSTIFMDINEISSSDLGIVIGKRGNTLDSLQYLISLHINRNSRDYIRILLDASGYREKREKTLQQLSENMAKKVMRTKRVVKLEPMNPYERRIIHLALQDREGIVTYSEGNEPFRRVVIKEAK